MARTKQTARIRQCNHCFKLFHPASQCPIAINKKNEEQRKKEERESEKRKSDRKMNAKFMLITNAVTSSVETPALAQDSKNGNEEVNKPPIIFPPYLSSFPQHPNKSTNGKKKVLAKNTRRKVCS